MSDAAPRILYIDDDEGLRRLAERALTRRGFAVSLAASGPDGREGGARVGVRSDRDRSLHAGAGRPRHAECTARAAGLPHLWSTSTGSEESRVAVAALKAGAADYVVKTIGEDFFDLLANSFQQALAQVRLRSAKEAVEEELRASNARLQALLREVNHRVANSLQLVSAMVHMQAAGLDEAGRAMLTDTERRIRRSPRSTAASTPPTTSRAWRWTIILQALLADLEKTCSTPSSPRRLTLVSEPLSSPPTAPSRSA